MKKTILAMCISISIGLPIAASANTIADIQSQIRALLERVAALQQQLIAVGGSAVATSTEGYSVPSAAAQPRVCAHLARYLKRNDRGDDVVALQEFLKERGYLSGSATGFFGPLTATALADFQQSEGVIAGASASGAGQLGPRTQAALMRWCGKVGNEFRFSAQPRRGESPLSVTFTAWVGGFTPYRYVVDFGDGSTEEHIACSAPADACTAPGTVTHTYGQNGTYTATLTRVSTAADAVREVIGREIITVGDAATVCTKEYAPVCARPSGCENTCTAGQYCLMMCKMPEPRTYSNRCMAQSAGATLLYEGACQSSGTQPFTPPTNCKSWYDGCNTCSRETPNSPAMCTLRACDMANTAAGYCTSYFDSTPANKPPVISQFSGPTTLNVNAQGTWTIAARDPEGGTLSYVIDWGDEPVASIPNSISMSARRFVQHTTFQHSYGSAGTYTVAITVHDQSGNETRSTTTVRVGDEPIACTMEYAPVCGSKQVQCIAAPCDPVQQTYSNRCMLNADGATFVSDGECQ